MQNFSLASDRNKAYLLRQEAGRPASPLHMVFNCGIRSEERKAGGELLSVLSTVASARQSCGQNFLSLWLPSL